MAMDKVKKNFIITRHFNSYCLLCDDCFKSDEESFERHIQYEQHRNAFKSKKYFENYEDDCIQQFKRGYYCEICDVLLATKKKISLHVLENTHIDGKFIHSMKQVANGVVFFNCLFIGDDAWHGLVDDTCVICNIDIIDKSAHKKDPSHIFVMIQSKLEFQECNVFRKIGNAFINCIICNDILNTEIFSKHLKSEIHCIHHAKCKENYIKVTNEIKETNKIAKDVKNEYPNEENTNLLLKKELSSLNKTNNFQDENKVEAVLGEEIINVSMLETNNTKAVDNVADLKETDNIVTAKIDTTKNNDRSIDESNETVRAELYEPHEAIGFAQDLAKKNKIKYKRGNSNAYCTVCDIKISSTIRRLKEHVAEEKHKDNITKLSRPAGILFATFLTRLTEVTVIDSNETYIIVNETFCITLHSYLMITRNGYTERCQVCDRNDNLYPLERHHKTDQHAWLSVHILVISSIQSEFIRQIPNKNLFHCGFCNFVASWEDMLQHLKSTTHKSAKMEALFMFYVIKKRL